MCDRVDGGHQSRRERAKWRERVEQARQWLEAEDAELSHAEATESANGDYEAAVVVNGCGAQVGEGPPTIPTYSVWRLETDGRIEEVASGAHDEVWAFFVSSVVDDDTVDLDLPTTFKFGRTPAGPSGAECRVEICSGAGGKR